MSKSSSFHHHRFSDSDSDDDSRPNYTPQKYSSKQSLDYLKCDESLADMIAKIKLHVASQNKKSFHFRMLTPFHSKYNYDDTTTFSSSSDGEDSSSSSSSSSN